jgi:hypothetical protein
MDLMDLAMSLRVQLASVRCEKCGQKPLAERLYTRFFRFNIPWPPEGSMNKKLIEAREQFGWKKGNQFRNGQLNPMETLLTEVLVENVDRRLPSP